MKTSQIQPVATFGTPPDSADAVRQQNRELTILNAIIQTVSNSYNLKETLETALDIILAEVGSSTGWVCLLDEQAGCSAFAGHKGLCFSTDRNEPTPCLVRCVCDRVRKTRDVVIIKSLQPGCPLLDSNDDQNQPIVGHVSVPLTTKSRIVGQLNVAFDDANKADRMDIRLLKSIGPQLAVAVENARLWETVQEKEEVRKELLKRAVTVQEEERRRISRELHDELGQGLTSLLVRLQFLENACGETQNIEILRGLKNSISQLLVATHDLALELRPTSLDDLGLVPALAHYAKASPENLGIQVDFETIGIEDGARLPREIETTLYRVVQESLTNVARHAYVDKASVLLKKNQSSISVIIEDTGVGFDPRKVRSEQGKNNRLGLYGMEERLAIVGGNLVVESSPGAGTTIYIDIPLG